MGNPILGHDILGHFCPILGHFLYFRSLWRKYVTLGGLHWGVNSTIVMSLEYAKVVIDVI